MNPNTLSALLDRNGTNAVLAHVYGEASDRAADRLRHAVCRFQIYTETTGICPSFPSPVAPNFPAIIPTITMDVSLPPRWIWT